MQQHHPRIESLNQWADDSWKRFMVESTVDVAVSLRNVSMTFPPAMQALRPITLEIPRGQFICFLGPSGCGKSTLLRIIAGLQTPTGGETRKRKSDLAYVFQDAHLLPWRNVVRNVALPLELAGIGRYQRFSAARGMLEQIQLHEFLDHHPAELSGGMKMRVSLARALVTEPSLLLLDEPFAAVDEMTRQKLDELLLDLWRQRQMTVIFVTHSVTEAVFLSQRAIVLSPRPGRVILDHAVDLPDRRDVALRSEASFAAQCGILYRALEQGGQNP
jgi:NitT/TauT family transport system ATP-binding protein